jgi:hypothetical protein
MEPLLIYLCIRKVPQTPERNREEKSLGGREGERKREREYCPVNQWEAKYRFRAAAVVYYTAIF